MIETASTRTGNLLIWDTGEYEILPYDKPVEQTDDESEAGINRLSKVVTYVPSPSEPSKLDANFRKVSLSRGLSAKASFPQLSGKGKIRLRLHGARLPENYTITLRMQRRLLNPRPNGPTTARRRRPNRASTARKEQTDSEEDMRDEGEEKTAVGGNHSDDEDHEIRLNNAYTGSINSIGSIHQRTWYVSLDRESSGFQRRRGKDGVLWERKKEQGELLGFVPFLPFFVRGQDAERSVVTGRLGKEVLADEGVIDHVSRAGWRPVLE